MRGRLRGGGKCLGFGMWTVGWTRWSRGRVGELESELSLLGARAFEKGEQVLAVVRVVSGPRGQTGEWAQTAWCEGILEGGQVLGARAFEKREQVLGVVRVVLGLRGRTEEWAQVAWYEGV